MQRDGGGSGSYGDAPCVPELGSVRAVGGYVQRSERFIGR